jgi:uncharacterized protein
MNTLDVNVLVAASRSDHPNHSSAISWLQSAISSAQQGQALTIYAMVGLGFLRVATHPRVFVTPTPIHAAWQFLEALRDKPGVEVTEGDTPWDVLKEVSLARELTGNDLPDAWLVAKVRHQHLRLATFDRGFKKMLRPSMLTLLT